VNSIFYGPPGVSSVGGAHLKFQDSVNGGSFPITLHPRHKDYPSERKLLIHANSLTGRPNYLQAVQLEFHFCVLLAVRDAVGEFQILQHLYWNLRWQATFPPPHPGHAPGAPAAWRAPHVIVAGSGAAVSPVYSGTPHDVRFSNIAIAGQLSNCNAVAAAAEAHPVVRESNLWQSFDVRL
jgi:hypothetical protein